MPYIGDPNKRQILKPVEVASDKGELNYQIFMTMVAYLERQEDRNYATISDALSSCIEAAEEFRRRVLVPYEDLKIEEKGDILPAFLLELIQGNDDE